jgi:uncharacterized protein (TIGR03790 family)
VTSSRVIVLALAACGVAGCQTAQNVLVLVNESSATSRAIAEYYVQRRGIPLANVCRLPMPVSETITRAQYDATIAMPLGAFLKSHGLVEKILYIVTTSGVPLRIDGSDGQGGDSASVDSELAAFYQDLHGRPHPLPGPLPNPFFAQREAVFRHPDFPMYLVTRLTGYDFPDVRGIVDRALQAKNRGRFVIDLKSSDDAPGNDWLRTAAVILPTNRVVFDESDRVLTNQSDVIAYAGWGSNDPHRKQRDPGFHWLPGAIVTEFVSTNARTFQLPPASWTLGTWGDRRGWFAGSPQSMTADYIHQGATGASGHVAEPWLPFTPRPDYLLPAYYRGRTLAESYWMSIPAISWQNIVVGDPLCSLGKPN